VCRQHSLTFVRTGQHTEQVAPPTATPPATPGVDPADTIELEPLVRNKAKLTSDGSKATFAFRCGAAARSSRTPTPAPAACARRRAPERWRPSA
jgi:hypothetical protein